MIGAPRRKWNHGLISIQMLSQYLISLLVCICLIFSLWRVTSSTSPVQIHILVVQSRRGTESLPLFQIHIPGKDSDWLSLSLKANGLNRVGFLAIWLQDNPYYGSKGLLRGWGFYYKLGRFKKSSNVGVLLLNNSCCLCHSQVTIIFFKSELICSNVMSSHISVILLKSLIPLKKIYSKEIINWKKNK